MNTRRLGYKIKYMLYREIIAVLSDNDSKHTNALRGQNAERLNVKSDRK